MKLTAACRGIEKFVFHFIVQSKTTQTKREFERPLFPANERQLLQEFCQICKVLNGCSFVKNWPNTRLSIHLGNDGRITNTGILPSDDEIALFLHRLRPIYLNNEQTNFNKIANLMSRHLADKEIAECVREWKRHYDGKASQDVFEIKILGNIINSGTFFDDYVNALEYHRDKDRRENIDAIAEHFPLEAQKPIFVLLLMMRLNAINKLASFLLTSFDREDGRPITIYVE
jgi:hypothetical protein